MIHPLIIKMLVLCYMSGAPLAQTFYAIDAETYSVSAKQLLAQAHEESRYQPDVLNGIHNGKRVRSRIGRTPKGFTGPFFCGTTQIRATTLRACKMLTRDVRAQYMRAAQHVEDWLQYCADNGTPGMRCAISGYAGGGAATRMRGKAWRYAGRIIKMTSGSGWRER